jgi:uncharacterized protein
MTKSRIEFLRGALIAFAIVALGLGTSGAAQAQQPPSDASIAMAKEIMKMKQAFLLYQGIVVNVVNDTRNSLMQTNINYQKDLEDVAIKVAGDLKGRDSEIENEMAKQYASGFTEAEMRDLLAFYKSPLGMKAIVNEPKAIQQSTQYINAWADKLSSEVMDRMRAEMKKRGKDI